MSISTENYWKKFAGIPLYRFNWYSQYLLYKTLRIKLPKLSNQRPYWEDRGKIYMDEILHSGYLEREVFFQNMLVDVLHELEWASFFEAGCGFGWNVRRIKKAYPSNRVGGLDFSLAQLCNAQKYLAENNIPIVNGDNCSMPLRDNAYDIGFSLGVFMNIHPSKINRAAREMTRVCKKYIIHLEWDDNHTTETLKEKRAFKTNIVSHDYKKLYTDLGKRVIQFKTYQDFSAAYDQHAKLVESTLDRWEGFEGPEKYIWIVVEV